MRVKGFILKSTALVIALFPLHISAAEDGKVFPGIMCKPESPSGAKYLYYYTSRILNNSDTEYVEVVCPIIADKLASISGLKDVNLVYRNERQDYMVFFTTTLRSFNVAGKTYVEKSAYNLVPPGETYISHMGNIGGYGYGFYAIHIDLPPKGSLINYRATEK